MLFGAAPHDEWEANQIELTALGEKGSGTALVMHGGVVSQGGGNGGPEVASGDDDASPAVVWLM